MINPLYDRIYTLINMIPSGKVATYGWIAAAVGEPIDAREVGHALRDLGAVDDVPWQRVINAQGEIPTAGRVKDAIAQRMMLAREGIEFDEQGRVDMPCFGWDGPPLEWLAANGYRAWGKPAGPSQLKLL